MLIISVFVCGISGKKLDAIYMTAWELGLKTTYYLKSEAATTVERSVAPQAVTSMQPASCDLDDESCEVCQ